MIFTELNQKGNFEVWDDRKLAEIRKGEFSEAIGELLHENANCREWKIQLRPSERLPFRRHFNTCACTAMTDGLLVSRNIDGSAQLIRFEKGETWIRDYSETEGDTICDLENVGEELVELTVIQEKLN